MAMMPGIFRAPDVPRLAIVTLIKEYRNAFYKFTQTNHRRYKLFYNGVFDKLNALSDSFWNSFGRRRFISKNDILKQMKKYIIRCQARFMFAKKHLIRSVHQDSKKYKKNGVKLNKFFKRKRYENYVKFIEASIEYIIRFIHKIGAKILRMTKFVVYFIKRICKRTLSCFRNHEFNFRSTRYLNLYRNALKLFDRFNRIQAVTMFNFGVIMCKQISMLGKIMKYISYHYNSSSLCIIKKFVLNTFYCLLRYDISFYEYETVHRLKRSIHTYYLFLRFGNSKIQGRTDRDSSIVRDYYRKMIKKLQKLKRHFDKINRVLKYNLLRSFRIAVDALFQFV